MRWMNSVEEYWKEVAEGMTGGGSFCVRGGDSVFGDIDSDRLIDT